jgi:2-hydroxychromene-2-carboxylate isomerase
MSSPGAGGLSPDTDDCGGRRALGARLSARDRAAVVQLAITHFTDPACPFAFSAEPVRLRLRWHYGEQLSWQTRMIVLTLEPGHAERLARGAPGLQRRYGMPIDPSPRARPASSEPACRAVVAARLHAPHAEDSLLRGLRVRGMAGGLFDDAELIAAAARDAGLDPAELVRWSASDEVGAALRADVAAARSPSAAARGLDHKLGGPPDERRYTAPSYEIANPERGGCAAIPGFNPIEAYETAIANLAPGVVRRAAPANVAELLVWAGEPLATAEVTAITGLDAVEACAELGRVADPVPAGRDFYWTLRSSWASRS